MSQQPSKSLSDVPLPESPAAEGNLVLLAKEGDITAGVFEVNSAFDLTLYQMPDGHFEVVVFMKLQFFFESGS